MTANIANIITAIRADYAANLSEGSTEFQPLLWIREGEHTSRYQRADVDAAIAFLARGDVERDIAVGPAANRKIVTHREDQAGVFVGGCNVTHIRISG